jgi:hypothetical protein
MAQSKTGSNDMGWWSDPDGEIVDPPYLTPDPGQAGECVCNYGASLMGFASGQYPNGDPVPEPVYAWHSNVSGEETD